MTLLEGHAAPEEPLAPRMAMKRLTPVVKALVVSKPESLWEQDTKLLPVPLRRYRRRCREFADRVLKPRALGTDGHDQPDEIQAVLVQAGREGYLSDLLPWPWGGVNPFLFSSPLQLTQSVKMEELCAACGGLGLLIGANALGTIPVILSGSLGPIRRYVIPAYRQCLGGKPSLFAFAITEPSGGSDVEDSDGGLSYRPGVVARKVPGGWNLTGRKCFISGGDIADYVCVFSALENEGLESWTCFIVSKEMEGFQRGRNELKMGQRASSATELIFEDLFVPDDRIVGGLRNGWGIARSVLNFSRIPVGGIALGIARGAAETAIGFCMRHFTNGKRLADYQDVQLEIAQMLTDLSAMRALVWTSASTFTPNQAKASMAKVFCADQSVAVCERAMDLMGNHGFLREHRVEKAYRDARLTQIYEGTNQINRLSIIEDQMEFLENGCR